MERRKFEDYWKDAFNQAEVSPSDNVWTNIELDLEKAKGKQLKKRLIFYQMLAAASVIFMLGIGIGIYVETTNKRTDDLLAETKNKSSVNKSETKAIQQKSKGASPLSSAIDTEGQVTFSYDTSGKTDSQINEPVINPSQNSNTLPNTSALSSPTLSVADSKNPELSKGSTILSSEGTTLNNKKKALSSERISSSYLVASNAHRNSIKSSEDNRNLSTLASDDDHYNTVSTSDMARKLPALVSVDELRKDIKISLQTNEQTPDPVALMLARLNEREKEIIADKNKAEKKKQDKIENLWTSVGFAAGSFNPVNSGTRTPSALMNSVSAANYSTYAKVASKETKASGISYSMGVNIGTKLTKRWVVQGGVNYLTQSSEYQQENLVANNDLTAFRPPVINDITNSAIGEAADSNNKLVNTPPYDVNNSVRFMSIPVQAGYLIVNRDFGVQLNAGVATDVFLQNTIKATVDGEKVDASKADIGENSAFRPLNLSGLLGTELSYKFAKNYRIALNPGLKYPFNSIYKSQDYKSSRFTFDVGLRFRYIFH